MGLTFSSVTGEIPLVTRVWKSDCDIVTDFTSVIKSASMIAFASDGDQWTVHLRGPETVSSRIACAPGWEYFGVDLRPGAYLPRFPPLGLSNLNDSRLPTLPSGRILLDNRDWEMPTAHNVDVFLDRLVRAGLLVFDPLVDEIRSGERPRGMSERVAQLRFRRATGLSHRKYASIERARDAVRLLSAGRSIHEVITTLGFYDQPQLTRTIRWATGHTPGELRSGTSFLAVLNGFRFGTRRSGRTGVDSRACEN